MVQKVVMKLASMLLVAACVPGTGVQVPTGTGANASQSGGASSFAPVPGGTAY